MFGLSFGEIVIIAIVALLLLGPDRLPEAAKTLGKGLREIRRATDDLKDHVEQEIYADG
jgi:sec-independent protein translocase protein TatB